MKMYASRSSVIMGCAGSKVVLSVVPRSPQRSLTRRPGGTTNCRRHPGWRAREGDSHRKRLPSAQPGKRGAMEVVHARCAGLDVHKKSVYGCVICCEANGEKRQDKRSFGTMTADLLSLTDWLRENDGTQ